MKVDFYKHNIGEKEIRNVSRVLRTLFLTTGPETAEFEKKFAGYLGCRSAVGVSSWTMGGLIALEAFGIGPGDEVITSPLTFIATANICLCLGVKPVFVDVEPETGNIDADQIEKAVTSKTKAILPVHLYGQMCDMKKTRALADRRGLAVIEDSAHCVEGSRDGIKPGQLSDAAVFSFYATKNITCGEGGAIATNRPEIAEKLLLLRLHGMSRSAADRYTGRYKHWDMEVLGYKCNMSDIQAALLTPQLERVEALLKKKEKICRAYEKAFAGLPGISFPKVLPGSKHARHLFTLWVPPERRDWFLAELQAKDIGVAVNFRTVHLMAYYRQKFGFKPGAFPVAERIGDSTISLPMYPKMTWPQVRYVISAVQEIARRMPA